MILRKLGSPFQGHPQRLKLPGVEASTGSRGALAWRVSGVITASKELYGIPVLTGAIGVQDRFGDSGAPWELIKEFGLSAEHIAAKAHELVKIKAARNKEQEEYLLEEALATSN